MPTVTLHPTANGDRVEYATLLGSPTFWQAMLVNDGYTTAGVTVIAVGSTTAYFHYESLPAGVGVITNVRLVVVMGSSMSQTNGYQLLYKKPGGSEVLTGVNYWYTAGWYTFTMDMGGMTRAEVNGLQAGVKHSQNSWGQAATYMALEITYDPGALPTVASTPAAPLEAYQATLNGMLTDDGGAACNCGFQWGLTVAYGNTTPTQSKTTGQTFTQMVTGLDPNTTYHFKAFAANPNGTSYGSDRSFTTPTVLPLVATVPAVDIDLSKAMLQGILAYDGGQACDSSFEWGLRTDYGNETPWQSGKNAGDAFIQVIASLEADTVYHFRVRARNNVGSATGTDMVLRTFKETIEVPGSLFDQSLRLLLEDEP